MENLRNLVQTVRLLSHNSPLRFLSCPMSHIVLGKHSSGGLPEDAEPALPRARHDFTGQVRPLPSSLHSPPSLCPLLLPHPEVPPYPEVEIPILSHPIILWCPSPLSLLLPTFILPLSFLLHLLLLLLLLLPHAPSFPLIFSHAPLPHLFIPCHLPPSSFLIHPLHISPLIASSFSVPTASSHPSQCLRRHCRGRQGQRGSPPISVRRPLDHSAKQVACRSARDFKRLLRRQRSGMT